AGPLELRQPERVVRAVRADLERVQGHAQVVDRAREGGEVVDEVDVPVHVETGRHVVVDEEEAVAAQVLHVLERARVEVVHADDSKVPGDEGIAEVGAEKAGPAGHDGGRHRPDFTRARFSGPQTLRPLYRGMFGELRSRTDRRFAGQTAPRAKPGGPLCGAPSRRLEGKTQRRSLFDSMSNHIAKSVNWEPKISRSATRTTVPTETALPMIRNTTSVIPRPSPSTLIRKPST